ncbi:MAG: serine/threonine protein kinase [Treponema sp.]|nr:serine/threonine protein kinase [Treponema sp.]
MSDDKTVVAPVQAGRSAINAGTAGSDKKHMIGKYQVLGIIAKGGMGVVYKAYHPDLKKEVVIKKMIGVRNKELRGRFEKEAQILLNMQSPYIIHFFDYFHEGPYLYIVEEFVNGMDLKQIIKKQTVIEPHIALLLLQDACLGLKFAHTRNIVHRDIKPGNILVSKKAEVKITDFGIASDHGTENTEEDITLAGSSVGTPAYMPPEQFENSSKVDQRADIFALGVMLYEMVTGRKPFDTYKGNESIRKLKSRKYTDPRKFDKNIPPVVSQLIKGMIAGNPRKRFSSVNPILSKIRKYLSRFDTHAIRVELARIILSPVPARRPTFVKKLNYWKFSFILAAIVINLSIAGIWFVRSGLMYETILKPWYTPVTFNVKMWKPESPVSDIPVQIAFFTGGKTINYVSGTKRSLIETGSVKNGVQSKRLASKISTYGIKPVYLRPGDYHIKMVYADSVYWRSVYVGKEPKVIDYNLSTNEGVPFKCEWEVFDSETGKNITRDADFLVNYKGQWIRYEDMPKDKLLSNRTWIFKFQLDGYIDDVFSCDVETCQEFIHFHSELIKDYVAPVDTKR